MSDLWKLPPLAMPQGNFPQMPVINEHAYGYNPSYIASSGAYDGKYGALGNHMVDPNFRMQVPPNTQEVPGYYACSTRMGKRVAGRKIHKL